MPETSAADPLQHPQERLNKQIRRRTDVAGVFPDRVPSSGAVPAEQTGEGPVARRYMGLNILAEARVRLLTTTQNPLLQTLTAYPAETASGDDRFSHHVHQCDR
ncbi:hypothetical protein ETD85_46695 [Nonomuraea zeae]|uniref:Uncharacterized protein n=1 Tax=Nonomuraea zeae TaxID=1642303 RepID=A0A5S4FUE2_9ACTN|nr:hypothetical protein ETD85_46695 [Nonomuraea zeae]